MKYYAVKSGRAIGVFESWPECQESIKGFSGADFKSFNTKEEAEAYIDNKNIFLQTIQDDTSQGYAVAFCDGSYDKNSSRYSFGVLIFDDQMQEHELCGSAKNQKYTSSNNIIGECLGVINALDWAISNNCEKIKIYHDYEGLSKWISGEWAAKSDVAKMYVGLYEKKYSGLIEVDFVKIKGHSNNPYNDKADELAKRALSNNARMPIVGDNWYTVSFFESDELETIMDLIKEESNDIRIEKIDKQNSIVYKLKQKPFKLSVTLFKDGKKKLLVQGVNTLLFQIFLTYVYELTGKTADHIIGSAYRKSIDSEKIDNVVNSICPKFPDGYPENIKRLVRQSIINLSYYVECEEYSQYVFPALRALEGHMKYLFDISGTTIRSKDGFKCFEYEAGKHYLPACIIADDELRKNLENCYNFYYRTRHTIFHFGDIIGLTDSTRMIESKEEADEFIKQCIDFICEEC